MNDTPHLTIDDFEMTQSSEPEMRPAASRRKVELVRIEELLSSPPADWIFKGYLRRGEVALLYGPSGSLKSFVLLEILRRIVGGPVEDDFNARTTGTVFLLNGEGNDGLRTRWQAATHGREPESKGKFLVAKATVPLLDAESFQELMSLADKHKPLLIGIDTLSRSIPGADENDATVASLVIDRVTQLARVGNSAIVLVHHTGKDDASGPRGSSAFLAGVDVCIRVKRPNNGCVARLEFDKIRDSARPQDLLFTTTPVELGHDEDGEPVISLQISNVAMVEQKKQPGDNLDVAICRALVARKKLSMRALADEVGAHRNTVDDHLKALADKGLVTKPKRGNWRVTEQGRQFALSHDCRE